MDKDKAIRAAKLTAKQVSSHKAADRVAELLRQGRASEITDDLMAQADPQRLHHHYTTGNTGMDMPMDQASRMERAAQMGFDTKAYHGTKDDFPAFDKRAYAASNYGVHTGAKDAANTILMHSKSRYDKSLGASDYPNKSAILPLMIKTKNNLRISDTGDWQPDKVMSAMAWSENPETEAMYRSIENHPSFPRFGTDDEETKFIADSLEQAGRTGFTYRNDYEGGGDSHATLDPTNIRSQFARFDPRLSHLSHLSASTGGAMELARAITAKNRAGGQIAPSKYLPNVPRAVHADGGRVKFGQFATHKHGNTTIGYKIDNDGVAEIHSVKTPQAKRGQGSARAAMNDFLSALDESGVKNTRLISAPLDSKTSPSKLVGFYKSLGFDTTGEIANQAGDPWMSRITKADGGPVMFQGIHPDLQGDGGAPLDLYHGTPKYREFEAFDDAKLGARDAGFYGRGHYLTPEKEIADSYSFSDDEYDFDGERVKGTVIGPLHAALKNPYVWDVSDDMKSSKTLRDLQSMGIMRDKDELRSWDNLQQHHVQPFMAEMKKRGHDGVIVKTGHEHLPNGISEVVAFDPKTIKHTEAEMFDPNDPRIRRDDGGRAGYADGGKSLGLYSKAAQIIRNQPQAKGNVDQLLAMVSKGKGVKPTELANAGRPAGDTMTKEELAQHFEQALPDVQVMRKGRVARNAVNALMQQDRRNWGQEDWDRANALNQEAERQPSSRYDQYTLPGGTNYREHLLHLPEGQGPLAKRRKELQDQWQQAYENQAPREELDRLGAEFDDLANDEGSDFKSSHWRTPNVLAHVRMDERDNGKTLHVQEVQSDWGQEGREMGFHDPENPYEVVNRKTKEVVSRHPDYSSAWDAYRTHPDSDNLDWGDSGDEKPPQGPYVGNTQQWTDLALKHVLTEAAKGGHDRVVFSPGEANADLYGQRKEVQMLKFLKSKDSGEAGILSAYSKDGRRSSEHDIENNAVLAKLIGKENATNLLAQPQNPAPEEGDNLYAHRLQGPLQVGGHGMVDYYKNYVHPGALKLLQQHDPSIKPESYDLPQGYKGFSLPMTDTARQSILKNGFQAFQRGGEVHKATGGPVMGYVPFAPIQIRRLATAPIAPQQSQQSVGRFSQSLGSLMDTVEGFKKKPEETAAAPVATPSPTTEGQAPSGMIPLPENGYQPSGMYAPFQSAIDQMISDAPGKISVASGYRTPERQAELWEGAAAKYPDPEVRDNWVARPGDSSHNYGLAADLSYADEEALKWAQENAARYGLNFRMDNEDWHIEPTNVFDIRSAMTIPGYATGGSVSKALSVTRGFTKDGKSAIGSLKPKGK